jgi:hypothetical protein
VNHFKEAMIQTLAGTTLAGTLAGTDSGGDRRNVTTAPNDHIKLVDVPSVPARRCPYSAPARLVRPERGHRTTVNRGGLILRTDEVTSV